MNETECGLCRHVRLSRVMEPYVGDMRTRLALASGCRVLDYGCGPLGALLPLPDVAGGVLGLDQSVEMTATARAMTTAQGVESVHLVHADLADLAPVDDCPSGLFDVAYGHFVLCYQHNVVGALERIAATVRPGGYIVAHEALLTAPIPVETPGRFHVVASQLMNEWLPALLGAMGACWDVAERYSMLCREAGLIEVNQRVFAPALLPSRVSDGIRGYHDLLARARPLLRQFDIAPDERIMRALHDLDLACGEHHEETMFVHMQVELVARVP